MRARAIRLAKGWNAQYSEPGLSSFNIEALAWECIEEMRQPEALAVFFSYATKELAGGETDDPVDVSGPIRLLLDQDEVVARLETASGLIQRALDHEDEETIAREALAQLFWDYVEPPSGSNSKATIADALRKGKTLSIGSTGLVAGTSTGSRALKQTRPYGDATAR